MMATSVFEKFVLLWVTIDPIGTVPVFLAVTAGMDARRRRRIALEASAFAALILLFFLVAGQLLFDALGIELLAFQIAGGLILFLFALTMIFGEGKPDREIASTEPGTSVAVFPLAMPSIASPGALLAVVLLTDNDRFGLADQAATAAIMLGVVASVGVLMLLAGVIHRLIGRSGAALISRIMGMILAALAVDNVLNAVIELIRTSSGPAAS